MCWHSCDTTVESNQLDNNGAKNFNGLGVLGDNFCSGIIFDGNTAIPDSAEYQSRIFNNSITRLYDGRANKKIAIRLKNSNYANGNKNYVAGNYSNGADNHFLVDAGGSMPSVEHAVTNMSCGQIEIFSPTTTSGFQMQDDTHLCVVVHNNVSGSWVLLPLRPTNGQICKVKNLQSNGTPSTQSFCYVQPAGSYATTIDKRFYQLKLMASTSTGDLESNCNQCATFVYVQSENTWVSISDAY
jgi:hypothetical protein